MRSKIFRVGTHFCMLGIDSYAIQKERSIYERFVCKHIFWDLSILLTE